MMKNPGFSLLEITVVLLIISILSLAAIPLFTEPSHQVRQSVIKVQLYKLANDLEQYHQQHKTYRGFKIEQLLEDYRLELLTNTNDHFRIAAIPKNKNAVDSCGTFFLDQEGNQSVSGNGSCW